VVHAVNGISYDMMPGEVLGVVGESGCGKSVHAMSIMRLIPTPPGKIASGEIKLDGRSLLDLSRDEIRHVRGRDVAMVFQDPMTSLNPVYTVGFQIMEALMLHKGLEAKAAKERAAEMLHLVGIPGAGKRVDDYPHQFSGGMRQRVMLAMALACSPALLIADEPTTALDVTIQAQIVDLVKDLRARLGMSILWITHDLGVVAELADRVAVMYAGYIVEEGDVFSIFEDPRHPYTLALLGALPRLDAPTESELVAIPGAPPDGLRLPPGCPFAPRCGYTLPRCLDENPRLHTLIDLADPTHRVACWAEVRR
jgi:oligopeptide transport system ATP-binding protein